MSFASEVKNELCRVPVSRPLLRRGRGLRRAAVLPHVHDAGDPHRHGVRRLCRAAAKAVSPRVRRALCPAVRGKGRRPPRADHHRPRRRRDGVRRLRRRSLAHGRAPHQPRRARERLLQGVVPAGGVSRGRQRDRPEQELPPRAHHGARERQPRDGRPAHGAGLCRAQHRPRREHRALFQEVRGHRGLPDQDRRALRPPWTSCPPRWRNP